jgi:hypothetical protein
MKQPPKLPREMIVPLLFLLLFGIGGLFVIHALLQPAFGNIFSNIIQCVRIEDCPPSYQTSVALTQAFCRSAFSTQDADDQASTPSPDVITLSVKASIASIYDGPSFNSRSIKTARCGDKFQVLTQANIDAHTWYLVLSEVGQGWIYGSYVILSRDQQQIPEITATP